MRDEEIKKILADNGLDILDVLKVCTDNFFEESRLRNMLTPMPNTYWGWVHFKNHWTIFYSKDKDRLIKCMADGYITYYRDGDGVGSTGDYIPDEHWDGSKNERSYKDYHMGMTNDDAMYPIMFHANKEVVLGES